MADSWVGTERVKLSLEHHFVPESKNYLKNDVVMSKGLRSQLKNIGQ
jgi:hypothetical protein